MDRNHLVQKNLYPISETPVRMLTHPSSLSSGKSSKSSWTWNFGVKFLFLHTHTKKSVCGFISSRLFTCLSGILPVTNTSELPKQWSKLYNLKVIINSLHFLVTLQTSSTQIPRAMPNHSSHKDPWLESLKYFTPEAHPATGHQPGAVLHGPFPATPQTREVKQRKMCP